jgi:hypothetical protein
MSAEQPSGRKRQAQGVSLMASDASDSQKKANPLYGLLIENGGHH